MASGWAPVCSTCGSSPCAFTDCQTGKQLFLSLSVLGTQSERAAVLGLLKAGFIPHVLDTRS